MFELQSKNPLAALDDAGYRGLAYDGCHFYLTVYCTCSILQLDSCFHRTACFNTRRAYTAICYDIDRKCFWAVADSQPCRIFKLNTRLEEIDRIKLQGTVGCCMPITGISYNCCKHSLVVAFMDEVVLVCPDCPENKVRILKIRQGHILQALSLCPYILCYCVESNKCSVCVYSENGELLHKTPVPFTAGLEAAVFLPCSKDFCTCHFLVLRTMHGCYPFLCEYTLSCDTLCNTLCNCNYDVCKPHPHPDPTGDACADVLESIALVEAALAHILNAEGEKIQKIVACSDDVCNILAVNESVDQTLSKVIFLEQILTCKLESLKGCCDPYAECKSCKSCGNEQCEHDCCGEKCVNDCI